MTRYLYLVAGLCATVLPAHGNAVEQPQHIDAAGAIEADSVCDLSQVPRKYTPETTQFIFDISCNEEPGIFRITGHGGQLSYAEKESGKMDPIRCQVMREGHSHGVIFNGEYKGQGKFEHSCDIGNGYTVRTIVDYTKGWTFTHKCPRYESRLSNLFDMVGLKEYYYEKFELDQTYALPYTTELELLEDGKVVFVGRQLQGFGIRGISDHITFNSQTHSYQDCRFGYSIDRCKEDKTGFETLKSFKYLKKSGLSGLGCNAH